MSNGSAIAAVTATLRQLLEKGLEMNITVLPLDLARAGEKKNQVNLFLYDTQVNAAWSNMDMPRQLKPGETGHPPLPLNLFYLLTAYSDDTNEVASHELLGQAMAILHDHPLLDASEIRSATESNVPKSDLHEQIERVRITYQPLSLEEISKLWAALQTQYRTSAAYQVSVVLIESTRPAKTPLPVLTRGKDDAGVASQADVESPFPTLLEIEPPNGQSSARLGDVVTLKGQRLDAGTLDVVFSNPRLPDPGPVAIQSNTASEIKVLLTDDPEKWVAGLYTVSVVFTNGDDVRVTNELPLTVAPRITTALPLNVIRDGNEDAEIDLTFSPRFQPGQRGALLIGDRAIPAEPLPTPPNPPDPTDTLKFVVKKAPLGTHFLRLRIDGVDSLLVQRPEGQPPTFDATQKVIIQ